MKDNFPDLRKIYSDDEKIVYDARGTQFSMFDEEEESKYLLDATVDYGKDYPSGYVDYDMYRVLNYLGYDDNIDVAFSSFGLKSSLNKPMMINVLLEHEFIRELYPSRDIDVSDEVSKMNASELSNLLRQHGFNVSGKKKKLAKMAIDLIPKHSFGSGEYEITDEGEKYLEEFRWIGLFSWHFEQFEFNEFYRYLDEHEGEYVQLALDFVGEHMKRAEMLKDFRYYDICLNAKVNTYAFENQNLKTLTESIKRYIIRLNPPMHTYSEYYMEFDIFDSENIDDISFFAEELEITDIKDLFYETWDSMELEKEYVSCDVAYEYLKKAIETGECEELSDDYDIKYFETPEEFLNIGIGYCNDGKYYRAIDYLNLSMEMRDNQSEALYYEAGSYFELKNFEDAIESIDSALEIDSNDARFYSLKAKCFSRLNDNDKAVEYFNKALDLNSKNTDVFIAVGDFYHENGDFDNALKYYDEAIEVDGEGIEALLAKSGLYAELEEWEKSEECFLEIHKRTGDSLEYFSQRGSYLLSKKDYEGALESFDKALEFNPNQAVIWMFKSFAYSELNDDDKFEECADRATKIDPMVVPAFINFFEGENLGI